MAEPPAEQYVPSNGDGVNQTRLSPQQRVRRGTTLAEPSRLQPIDAELLSQQRQELAENPLCRLASETVVNPPEVLQAAAAQPPSRLSGFVAGFFRRLMQVIGLERLLQTQPIPQTTVAVVPRLQDDTGAIAAVPDQEDGGKTQLVSNRANTQATSATGQEDTGINHELWVRGHRIAEIRTRSKADLLAERLERLVGTASFNATAIAPKLHQGNPAIAMGDQILFVIDEGITREESKNYEVLAIRWANNLRLAFDVPALDLVEAQAKMYGIEETNQSLEGLASWYGPYFHGRLTANGETYDQHAFTAAHPSMPLGTYLKITNLDNDKSVIIRLNDRGPYIKPRSLDLSLGAARCLNSVETGVIPYRATIMKERPAIATEAI